MRKGGPSPEEQLAAQRQAELRREAELVERRRREQQVRPAPRLQIEDCASHVTTGSDRL